MKYAVTYRMGKVVVNIVAPLPITEAEKERILKEYRRHFLKGWNALPVERRLAINAMHEAARQSE
ncbi:hypothetical protein P22_2311 [Propionispora sp. 2/2-37]|uniref:hypothetical protein n=1 Tax=Propionispora sp. 2/2-37 TaxID=1677858 RepID=UPI0006BB7BB9|nr:hypothetical protein [Propionispora sp. 2/2-37]CUH96222.1 hypothetical protein P22_2311 [Propionispora sp. 2/2-37]